MGSISIKNSTFFGNSANARGGAIYNEQGLMRIESCTIAGNTALLRQGASINTFGGALTVTRLSNSIVADNRTTGGGADSGTGVDFGLGPNSTISRGHNILGGGVAVSFTGAGDRVGVTVAQINLVALAPT